MAEPDAGYHWEVLRWMGVESATCALGEAAAFVDRLSRSEVEAVGLAGACVLRDGALAVLNTRADLELPVEVHREEGTVVAARLCVTDDVEGIWETLGAVTIGIGEGVAGDPCGSPSELDRAPFPMKAGAYLAEVFVTDGDQLALRVRLP